MRCQKLGTTSILQHQVRIQSTDLGRGGVQQFCYNMNKLYNDYKYSIYRLIVFKINGIVSSISLVEGGEVGQPGSDPVQHQNFLVAHS